MYKHFFDEKQSIASNWEIDDASQRLWVLVEKMLMYIQEKESKISTSKVNDCRKEVLLREKDEEETKDLSELENISVECIGDNIQEPITSEEEE